MRLIDESHVELRQVSIMRNRQAQMVQSGLITGVANIPLAVQELPKSDLRKLVYLC